MRNLLIAIALLVAPGVSAGADLDRARELYQSTRYEEALQALKALPERHAAIRALAGKCHYMLGEFREASEEFQRAVDSEPGNSRYHLWTGRAFGRRAERSSFLTAPRYASRARQSFERAVELDPRNLEALSDLFEYYLQAPGFLGGGTDKAAALAERIRELDQAEYHWARARMAERRKDFKEAEREFRRAMELAPNQVGRTLDLARFLSGRGRHEESEELFSKADGMAPGSPRVMFSRARVYVRAGRRLEEACQLLERYLGSSLLTPEDPPRWEARELLKEAQRG